MVFSCKSMSKECKKNYFEYSFCEFGGCSTSNAEKKQ